MPIYEFECTGCGLRFEELTGPDDDGASCPDCSNRQVRRVMSTPAPPGRLPRGPAVRDSESRRSDREAARRERLAESAKRRARGESPRGDAS